MSNTNIQPIIRFAEPNDLPQLTALMLNYIVDFYQRPQPPAEKLNGLIHTLFERKEGLQFVAEHDGRLLGFATLYFTYSTLSAQKAAIMNDLFVSEKARGTGVAEALFKTCRRYTQENGFAFMSWETARDNHRAQRFYEKMGGQAGDWLTYSI